MSVHQLIDRHDVLTQADVVALIPELAAKKVLAPIMSEAAAPDVPAAVGFMIVGFYAMIMIGLFVGFAHGTDATMMVVISTLFTTIYLTVPLIMLKVEGVSGRVGLDRFFREGLNTWTGHLSGHEALVQMLLIPSALIIAVFAIGLVARFSA